MSPESSKRAAIYARVSTHDKQNYQSQVNELTKVAKEHGCDEVEVFAESISGYKKLEFRYEMERLFKIIRKDPTHFSCVYVSEISRLGRDPKETTNILNFFSDYNVPVYIKNIFQFTIVNGQRNNILEIIIKILVEFADQEARFTKERFKRGLLDSARSGKAGGSKHLPYGYRKDENKFLVVDPEEAEIIVNIFNWYLEGNGTKRIATLLNSHSIPTRYNKVYTKNIKLKNSGVEVDPKTIKWSDAVVYSILTNPLYKGERRYKNEIINAPAIIASSQWQKVQDTLKEKFNAKIKSSKYVYLLKDLATCGKCGRNYFGRYKSDGRDKFYMCSSRRTKNGNCGNKGISIEFLEGIIWKLLSGIKHGELSNIFRNSKTIIERLNVANAEMNKTEEEIQAIKKQEEKLIELYTTERISLKKFDEERKKYKPLLAKLTKAKLDLERVINSLQAEKKDSERFDMLESEIKQLPSNRVRMQELTRMLIKRIIIHPALENDFLITVYFKNETDLCYLLTNRKENTFVTATGEYQVLKYDSHFRYVGSEGALNKWIKIIRKETKSNVLTFTPLVIKMNDYERNTTTSLPKN